LYIKNRNRRIVVATITAAAVGSPPPVMLLYLLVPTSTFTVFTLTEPSIGVLGGKLCGMVLLHRALEVIIDKQGGDNNK
jgi:hypothetical protein